MAGSISRTPRRCGPARGIRQQNSIRPPTRVPGIVPFAFTWPTRCSETRTSAVDATKSQPYPLEPTIISAGPDEEFGMLDYTTDSDKNGTPRHYPGLDHRPGRALRPGRSGQAGQVQGQHREHPLASGWRVANGPDVRSAARGEGLTLVELLLVLLIITILAALGVPAYMVLSRGRLVSDTARTVQAVVARARDQGGGARHSGRRAALARRSKQPARLDQEHHPDSTADQPRHRNRPRRPASNGQRRPARPAGPEQTNATVATQPANLIVAGLDFNGGTVNFDAFSTGGLIRFEDAGPLYAFGFVDSNHLRILGIPPHMAVYNPVADTAANAAAFNTRLQTLEGVRFKIQQYAVPLELARTGLAARGASSSISVI